MSIGRKLTGMAPGSALGALHNGVSEFLFDQVGMTHRFHVRIDTSDYDLGTWSKVSGLKVSWKVIKYRPGESNDVLNFPGNTDYPPITLERAACSDSATVQRWLRDTSRRHDAFSGAVSMVDHLGLPVVAWELKQFFPSSWSIATFDSTGAKPAIEQLVLAHTGFLDDETGPGL